MWKGRWGTLFWRVLVTSFFAVLLFLDILNKKVNNRFSLYPSFSVYFTQKFIVFVSVSSITIILYNFYLFLLCLSNSQLPL